MRHDAGRGRRRRSVTAATVAFAAAIAFAALGGVALAKSTVGPTQPQSGQKVTICHKGKRTITISVSAWPAHQRHLDTLGTCATAGPVTNHGKHKGWTGHAPTTSTTTTTEHGNGQGNGDGNGHGKSD
jgi:hypothetical protein